VGHEQTIVKKYLEQKRRFEKFGTMKKARIGLFVLSLAALMPGIAAASVEISIGGPELSASGAADVPDDAITLFFDDFAANTVQLTLSANPGAVKVKDIIFNVAPSFASLAFAHVSGVVASDTEFDPNGFQLNSLLSGFDVLFSYGTSGANGSFFNGQTSVYNLSAPGLTAAAFNAFNDDGSGAFRAAAHINKPNNTSPSGKYGGNGDGIIPEPASLLVWGALGLCGLVGLAHRRRIVRA
jgi:hypothetical protein